MTRLSTSGYAAEAPDLLARYEALDPEQVNAHWRAPAATLFDKPPIPYYSKK